MDNDTPIGFYFKLTFKDQDIAFQEVSGISKEFSIEEVASDGENQFKYRLPTVSSSENLVLRRAIVPPDSLLVNWCESCINQGLSSPIQPENVTLSLVNANDQTIMQWTFHNAFPVKYAVSDLNTQLSDIAIESLELAYTNFEISPITTTNLFT
ncbi:phage tail protein [Flavobacterium sp. IMCC34518]|uniref:phage tail protein n=1 Tax=Flavobacterium sp. IMCC34518 TaxID=3003623 RepID=UPI0022AC5C04|nr:phage tail protein [Flavobacterium sp. IMCC34518]